MSVLGLLAKWSTLPQVKQPRVNPMPNAIQSVRDRHAIGVSSRAGGLKRPSPMGRAFAAHPLNQGQGSQHHSPNDEADRRVQHIGHQH